VNVVDAEKMQRARLIGRLAFVAKALSRLIDVKIMQKWFKRKKNYTDMYMRWKNTIQDKIKPWLGWQRHCAWGERR
jgi:hypothetical protein